MNREQLVNNICDLSEIGDQTAAAGLIEDYIDKYTNSLLNDFKKEILTTMIRATPNRGWRGRKRWEQKIIKLCGGETDGV